MGRFDIAFNLTYSETGSFDALTEAACANLPASRVTIAGSVVGPYRFRYLKRQSGYSYASPYLSAGLVDHDAGDDVAELIGKCRIQLSQAVLRFLCVLLIA
jgi:hypothetical protein